MQILIVILIIASVYLGIGFVIWCIELFDIWRSKHIPVEWMGLNILERMGVVIIKLLVWMFTWPKTFF